MTNSRLTDPEILEFRFPVLLEDFHIREGSGGKGKWSAGDGTKRTLRFLEKMDDRWRLGQGVTFCQSYIFEGGDHPRPLLFSEPGLRFPKMHFPSLPQPEISLFSPQRPTLSAGN
jgi:hypothetical protein